MLKINCRQGISVAVSKCLLADLCTRQVPGGSIVGICEMVDGGPRMHTVSAGTIVELMVLEAIRFHDIMKHFPRVMGWVAVGSLSIFKR